MISWRLVAGNTLWITSGNYSEYGDIYYLKCLVGVRNGTATLVGKSTCHHSLVCAQGIRTQLSSSDSYWLGGMMSLIVIRAGCTDFMTELLENVYTKLLCWNILK